MLGLLGLAGTFAPDAALRMIHAPAAPMLLLLVQIVGALYRGFAVVNWMTRDNLIGGFYSRPVAVGNLLHFLTAGLAAVKLLRQAPQLAGLWPLTLVYAAFAVGFAIVLVRHPIRAAAPAGEGALPA
jgi:hypothetical protein